MGGEGDEARHQAHAEAVTDEGQYRMPFVGVVHGVRGKAGGGAQSVDEAVLEPGAEVVAQDPEDAERDVGVRDVVRGDHLRLCPAVQVQQRVEDVQGVARGARHDHLSDAPTWSFTALSQMMPRLNPKYFGLGAASMVRTGTTNRSPPTEASSTGRHDLPTGARRRVPEVRTGRRLAVAPGSGVCMVRRVRLLHHHRRL